MNSKDNRQRALKGYVSSSLMGLKQSYILVTFVLLGLFAAYCIVNVILALCGAMSNSSGGALLVGFGVAAIFAVVTVLMMSAGKGKRAAFIFPIDRKTFAIGSFIMFILNSAFILLLSAVFYLGEVIVYKILGLIFDNIMYINNVTFESYITGFWVSLFYILFVAAITFFLSILFSRFKFPAVIIVSLAIGLPFIFPFGREAYYKFLMFFIGEQSLVLICLKLLICSMLLQFISYLPLKKMEVIE
ncbi:MAG: hypothetical protein Q8920_08715 [Bacillota bacterium]|nr:hypothetical protein [Bacillota bacterium]